MSSNLGNPINSRSKSDSKSKGKPGSRIVAKNKAGPAIPRVNPYSITPDKSDKKMPKADSDIESLGLINLCKSKNN